jgi:protein ImuB
MSGSVQQSLLPFAQPALPMASHSLQEETTAGAVSPADGRLWLCLYLPDLPLEVLCRDTSAPCVVLDGVGQGAGVVLLCDESAARQGVQPGMPVNAALALLPDLEIQQRRPGLEHEALLGLAVTVTRFTPVVSIDPCGALLLEIGGSNILFGGAGTLRSMAVAATTQRGHAVSAAVAPTARAALWLAWSGEQAIVTEMALLPGVLARLPLRLPGWPVEVRRRLRRMGVRRLGECMRLPRDGLARRIGQGYLAELDQALGRRAEVRQIFHQQDRFTDELELPCETRSSVIVMGALEILLGRLGRELRQRQAAAWILWVYLQHRGRPATMLRVGLLRPSADMAQLKELTGMHLSRSTAPEPVVAVKLEAELAREHPPLTAGLFGWQQDRDERLLGLMERLRMRLGHAAVHGIGLCSEHRPEAAWHVVSEPQEQQSGSVRASSSAPRPLWLLESPVPLESRNGIPLFSGRMVLESGPERIETGWWDGHDIRRDYHVARNSYGQSAWVFRDLRHGGWYLHGLFG